MQLANARIVLNREGTDVPRKNLTPAEAQLIKSLYEPIVGGNPITHLEVIRDKEETPVQAAVIVSRDPDDPANQAKWKVRKRTPADEIRRLRSKYVGQAIEKFFPGMNPNMPETFEDAGFEENQAWQAPSKKQDSAVQRLKGPSDDDQFTFIAAEDGFDLSQLEK